MKIKINNKYNVRICTHCNCTGKIKAIQSMVQTDCPSIHVQDKETKCKYCHGRGGVISR